MEALDIVREVAKDSKPREPKRLRTIPIYEDRYAWWTNAVRRQIAEKGLNQKLLSVQLGAKEPEVSRCISRQVPTYDLLIAISDALEVPYPAILPSTEAEALHLATQRRLFKRDEQVAQIATGVADNPKESQSTYIVSEHAIRQQRPKRPKQKRPAAKAVRDR